MLFKNSMKEKLIYIKSYGCQMNVYDSNRMKDLFLNKGYKITEDVSEANLTILNTCHIREKAVEKVYSDIGRIKKLQNNKKDTKLVVAGCVAQAEGNEIKKRSPIVDFVVGPQSYHKHRRRESQNLRLEVWVTCTTRHPTKLARRDRRRVE